VSERRLGEGVPHRGNPRVLGVAGKCCAGKDLVTHWLLENHWREINVDQVGHRALEALRDEIVREFGSEILRDDGEGGIDRARLGRIVFSREDRRKALEAIVHPWMRAEIRREVERFRAAPASTSTPTPAPASTSTPAPATTPLPAPQSGCPPSGESRPVQSESLRSGPVQSGSVRSGPVQNGPVQNGPAQPRGLVINAALLFYMELDSLCDAIILVRAPLFNRVVRAIRRDGFDPRRVVLRLWSQRRLETQARLSPADIITVDNRGTPEALRRRLQDVPQLRQEPGERTEYGAE
jgi:dephospho-CoA kinase